MKQVQLQDNFTLSKQTEQQARPLSPQEVIDVLASAQARGLIPPGDKTQTTLQARHAVANLTYEEAMTAAHDVLAVNAAGKAMDAIKALNQPGDIVELCAIGTDRSVVALCGDLFDPEQGRELRDFARSHFGHNNIYVGICPRKPDMAGQHRRATDADVQLRRLVVLDLDFKDAPDVDRDWSRTLDALRTLGPVLVVHSGNGWQIWFELEEQTGAALAAATAPISEALALMGSDAVHEPSRLARLPYTLNVPSERKRLRGAVLRLALPDTVAADQELAA